MCILDFPWISAKKSGKVYLDLVGQVVSVVMKIRSGEGVQGVRVSREEGQWCAEVLVARSRVPVSVGGEEGFGGAWDHFPRTAQHFRRTEQGSGSGCWSRPL